MGDHCRCDWPQRGDSDLAATHLGGADGSSLIPFAPSLTHTGDQHQSCHLDCVPDARVGQAHFPRALLRRVRFSSSRAALADEGKLCEGVSEGRAERGLQPSEPSYVARRPLTDGMDPGAVLTILRSSATTDYIERHMDVYTKCVLPSLPPRSLEFLLTLRNFHFVDTAQTSPVGSRHQARRCPRILSLLVDASNAPRILVFSSTGPCCVFRDRCKDTSCRALPDESARESVKTRGGFYLTRSLAQLGMSSCVSSTLLGTVSSSLVTTVSTSFVLVRRRPCDSESAHRHRRRARPQ